jgi:5-methylcytosine-specific restriction enzyme subunit McrC
MSHYDEELPEFSIQDERRLKGIFEYDPANNPQRRRAVVPKPDFALLAHGKVIEFLDAKYRDLWETPLPSDMLYRSSKRAWETVRSKVTADAWPRASLALS